MNKQRLAIQSHNYTIINPHDSTRIIPFNFGALNEGSSFRTSFRKKYLNQNCRCYHLHLNHEFPHQDLLD